MNNCGIFMREYRYIHILLNCKNVGMDTGLCVSMCKWMSVFESCYCTKAAQTMQIITIDALVKTIFHLTSICKNFFTIESLPVGCTNVKWQQLFRYNQCVSSFEKIVNMRMNHEWYKSNLNETFKKHW